MASQFLQKLSRLRFSSRVIFVSQHIGTETSRSCQRRHFATSNCFWKQFDVPEREEVIKLEQRYPYPKAVIEDIFTSLKAVDIGSYPKLSVVPKLGGRCWCARLEFTWPIEFSVTGKSADRETAEKFAYLQACDLFKFFGMLNNDYQVIDYKRWLDDLQRHVSNYIPMTDITISSAEFSEKCGKDCWQSTVNCEWPMSFQVTALGKTKQEAERNVSALVCFKLNRHYLLRRKKSFFSINYTEDGCIPENYNPDSQIFVDASRKGFGAYLVQEPNEDHRYIQEEWPEIVQKLYISNKAHTSFLEFYALVTACITWKRKLAGQKVLCMSDNMFCVDIINRSLPTKQHTILSKMYKELYWALKKHNIYLMAKHIKRSDNYAADSLSKLKTDEFHRTFPQARTKPSKIKKLLYFLPFELQCQ